MPKTNVGPHPFAISDEDLFSSDGTVPSIVITKCAVCGDQPGQGVHQPPPPPPVHLVIIDEVAKTLAASESGEHPWDQWTLTAARGAFTTIQQVRAFLKQMGERAAYQDSYPAQGAFEDVDTELDNLLTELRKQGWES